MSAPDRPPVPPSASEDPRNTARNYGAAQNRLFVIRWALTLIIIAVYLVGGLSQQLADGLRATFSSPWMVNAIYVAITVFGFAVLMFPVSLYEEYSLEQAFGRSDQTLGEWFRYYIRGLLLELAIVTVFFEVLYALLRHFPGSWWFWTAVFYIGVVIVFSALAPVVILPLFYKARPILDAPWLPQVRRLLDEARLPDVNLFEWGFSDRTHAENVVLAGMGKTRRILIADTVLADHTDDEIVAFVAHELGHFRHGDLWRSLLMEGLTALAGFYVAHNVLIRIVPLFGFASPADIAAFPILVFSLFVLSLIIMPVANAISRSREYAADAFAVQSMGTAEPLIRALQKANAQNLSDPYPTPVWEALLHSHPSLERRIARARKVEETLRTAPENHPCG